MTIPIFDPAKTAFKFNERYDVHGQNEANTYREILMEGTWKFGTDIVYIERDRGAVEPVFVETVGEAMKRGTPLRVFVEEVQGWGGMGDTFSKFGIRVGDEMTIYCPKELFRRTRPDEPNFYPKAGDLIYHVPGNKLFEITSIEDELPPSFYLFGNEVSWKFSCRTYNYEHSEIDQADDNGIPDVVKILDQAVEEQTDIERNTTPWVDYGKSGIVDESERDPLE